MCLVSLIPLEGSVYVKGGHVCLMFNPRVLCFNNGILGIARPSGFILRTVIGFHVFIGFRCFIGLCRSYLSNCISVYTCRYSRHFTGGGSLFIVCFTYI